MKTVVIRDKGPVRRTKTIKQYNRSRIDMTAPKLPVLFLSFLMLYWNVAPSVTALMAANAVHDAQLKQNVNLMPVPQSEMVTVDGLYLDKKGNPITNASVIYQRDGSAIASATTDAIGYFSLEVLMVGAFDYNFYMNGILSQNKPNPFALNTLIDIKINESGVLKIFDLAGKVLEVIELEQPGNYQITWNGANNPGVYIYNLRAGDVNISKKMISKSSDNGGLNIDSYNSLSGEEQVILKNEKSIEDSIKFIKPNTSLIEYPFELTGNIYFEEIGNPGPEITESINNATGSVGDILSWPIFDHVYNDEETNEYTPISENTWVVDDTLYPLYQPRLLCLLPSC